MVKIEKFFVDMVKKSLIVLFRYILILPNRNETKQTETKLPKYRNYFVLVVHWGGAISDAPQVRGGAICDALQVRSGAIVASKIAI